MFHHSLHLLCSWCQKGTGYFSISYAQYWVIWLLMELPYVYYQLWVLKILWVEIVFSILVSCLTLELAHTHEKRSLIVGILCTIFGISMYAMPLDIMVRWKQFLHYVNDLICSIVHFSVWVIFADVGYKNKKCGVHAILTVIHQLPQCMHLVYLCAALFWSLHFGTKT